MVEGVGEGAIEGVDLAIMAAMNTAMNKQMTSTASPRTEVATSRPASTVPPPVLLVTVKQACEMLGLGRTSIHHLVRNGELTPIRIGTAVRFSIEHLHRFVDAHMADR